MKIEKMRRKEIKTGMNKQLHLQYFMRIGGNKTTKAQELNRKRIGRKGCEKEGNIEQLQNEIQKLQMELEQKNKELKHTKFKHEKEKQKTKELKREARVQGKYISDLVERARSLQYIIHTHEDKQEELNKVVGELKGETKRGMVSQLKNKVEELEKNKQRLLKENQRVKSKNYELQNEIKHRAFQITPIEFELMMNEVEGLKGENERLLSQFEMLEYQIQVWKDKYINLNNSLQGGFDESEIKNVVAQLQGYLSYENLHYYKEINNLSCRVRAMNLAAQNQKGTKVFDINQGELLLGYVMEDKGTYWFQGLDGKSYKVKSDLRKLISDLPAKASVINGYAYVVEMYSDEEVWLEKAKVSNKERFEKVSKGEKQDYVQFGRRKVLIVGSRNLSRYEERLRKHGLYVMTHNPFEESVTVLEGKSLSAEVIIICKRHISHDIMHLFDFQEERVQFVERDNEEVLFQRTYFSLEKQGFLPAHLEEYGMIVL